MVQTEIDSVLAADPAERRHQLELLRAAFIPWLATINPDTDAPVRRRANLDRPARRQPTTGRSDGGQTPAGHRHPRRPGGSGSRVGKPAAPMGPARRLAGRPAPQPQTADDLHRTATAWRSSGHDPAWLLTGTRLRDAQTLAGTPEFEQRLAGVRDLLDASRGQAQANLRAATAQKLIAQAQGMLAGTAARRGRARLPADPGRPHPHHPRRRGALQRALRRGGSTGQHPEDHHRPHRLR